MRETQRRGDDLWNFSTGLRSAGVSILGSTRRPRGDVNAVARREECDSTKNIPSDYGLSGFLRYLAGRFCHADRGEPVCWAGAVCWMLYLHDRGFSGCGLGGEVV